MLCDPCFSENVEKPAVSHCEECDESFCESCKNVHSKMKLGKTHTLRDIRNVPSQQDRAYLNQLKSCACSDQQVKPVEYLCNDHGEFCCGKCQFSKHRNCKNVEEIEDLIGKGTGKRFDTPLGVLKEKIQELTKIAAANTQLAEESYTDVEKRLVEVKQEIDDAYNELKTKVLSKAKTRKETLISEIQQQSQNIETLSIKLNKQKADTEIVNRYGNDVDKYIFNHVFERSSWTDLNSSENLIRSSLVPRQFIATEKHNIEDIVRNLKVAIDVIDKEMITGSDSHESVVLSGPELNHRMRLGTRVVRGQDWLSCWKDDGGAGGKGTIVAVDDGSFMLSVKWDCNGRKGWYNMGRDGKYRLQLATD